MTHPMLLLLLGTLWLTGCARQTPSHVEPVPSATPAPLEGSPQAMLDRLDARRPVPLLPMMAAHQKQNMRDHLVAVQEVVSALAAEDYEAIERAATRLGSSDQMGRMCTHMGAGAPGFSEEALGFHDTANGITRAARERDRRHVLDELGTTLRRCTGCHATWKQQVVDEASWNRVTSRGD